MDGGGGFTYTIWWVVCAKICAMGAEFVEKLLTKDERMIK
jgi:hypothetical protein